MKFERFFRLVSYAAVFCGFLSLWVSGAFGVFGTVLFAALLVAAWRLEGSRWQISERVGTALIVLALPAFALAWKFQIIAIAGGDTAVASVLSQMIIALAAVKLLQKKSDRDWIFLYLMSFFEVLLAAGLSISPLYIVTFIAYLLVMVSAIIAFEIRKTSRAVELKISGGDHKERDPSSESQTALPVRRLPTAAVVLIVFIVAFAVPLFFLLPRVGGAGFGGNQFGMSTQSGFSDTVRLGGFGRINQTDEAVMRVKLEGDRSEGNLYFRGVALDTFDNQSWSKSKGNTKAVFEKGEDDFIRIDPIGVGENRTIQTIYLEPLDTPVLFALPRAVAVQGNFPVVNRDAYGGLSFPRNFERTSYKVISDRSLPSAAQLRADDQPYTADVRNYVFLPPVYDGRIAKLAETITASTKNPYDKARVVESYLQTNFGYTLEKKAGGSEPLADFLFNVQEGHCEYFATAMAVMLRTQGIATRIVNGFHGGDYNDAAGVTIVRQRNAHAWVEVFFPKENVWVPFDPTPFAGQSLSSPTGGVTAAFNKYLEALETLWIQRFVAYDSQEQRSLANTVRNSFADYQARISSYITHAQAVLAQWWAEVRGDRGMQNSLAAIGFGIAYLVAAAAGIFLIVWLFRKAKSLDIWKRSWNRFLKKKHASVVEFYSRMQRILAGRGLRREPHQTPLEFAFASGMAEAVSITEKYNRVRFGEKDLSDDEARSIEKWLKTLKAE
jgi:transglutaminase-like putative cysteine protease